MSCGPINKDDRFEFRGAIEMNGNAKGQVPPGILGLLGAQEREQPDLVLNRGGPDCGMRVPSTECRDNCVHESEQPVSGQGVRRERRLSVPLHPRFTVSVCLHVSPGIHCLIKCVLRQEAVHLTPSIRKHSSICTH